MLFLLKKFITFWLLPLPFCCLLMATGLWLTRRGRVSRLGRSLQLGGLLALAILSSKPVSRLLSGPLERQFSAQPECVNAQAPSSLQGCRFVAVLGGGHGDDDSLPASTQLSEAALGRLVEGIRLWRLLPGATLVVSGPSDGVGRTHGLVLATAAVSLGVPRDRIIIVDTARDTEDEAAALLRLSGGSRVALVTSAWHMPRAQALFRGAGVDSIPCPADFKTKEAGAFSWRHYTWDTESLTRSTMALREYLGLLWLKLRGKH